jgi:hypothetical protein
MVRQRGASIDCMKSFIFPAERYPNGATSLMQQWALLRIQVSDDLLADFFRRVTE